MKYQKSHFLKNIKNPLTIYSSYLFNIKRRLLSIPAIISFGLFSVLPTHADPVYPLNPETVLCVYYKLSGESFDQRDLEDFNYQQGRPTFTIFKPAEMFTKSSLRELQQRLQKQIAGYNQSTLFALNFKGPWDGGLFVQRSVTAILIHSNLPFSTPYIGSVISEPGQKEIMKTYYFLLKDASDLIKSREIDITVYLRPSGISRSQQMRNIARENIYLPIRMVIFEPVRLRIAFPSESGRLIFFREVQVS